MRSLRLDRGQVVVWTAILIIAIAATLETIHVTAASTTTQSSSACRLYLMVKQYPDGDFFYGIHSGVPDGNDRMIPKHTLLPHPELVLNMYDVNRNEYSPWHEFVWNAADHRHRIYNSKYDANEEEDDDEEEEEQRRFKYNHTHDVLVSGIGTLTPCSKSQSNIQTVVAMPEDYHSHDDDEDDDDDDDDERTLYYFVTTRDISVGEPLLRQCNNMEGEFNDDRDVEYTTFSLSELQEHGVCVDVLDIQQSHTIPRVQTGATQWGAFARQSIRKGDVVAVSPVIHMDRSQVEIYQQQYIGGEEAEDEEEDEAVTGESPRRREPHPMPMFREHGIEYASHVVGVQMLINYCYGHPGSDLLLWPIAPGVNFINHPNPNQKPNVQIQWSSRLHNSTYIRNNVPLMELLEFSAGAMVIEYVALSDIAAGDEILLDYGDAWVHAYQNHTSSFSNNSFRHEIGVPEEFYPSRWMRADPNPQGDFMTDPLPIGVMAPIRWKDPPHDVVTPWGFRIGLHEKLRTVLLEYCNKLGITDILRHATLEGNGLEPGTNMHLGIDGGDGITYEWYLQRPAANWRSNLHWLSPGGAAAHEHYLQALSAAGFDDILDGIGRHLNMDGLVAFHVTFIAVTFSNRGYLHYDVQNTGGKVFNVIIPLMLANETGPELDLQESSKNSFDEETLRVGRYRYRYGKKMLW
jgi:hypothetical protein